jgi:hypothetical protein
LDQKVDKLAADAAGVTTMLIEPVPMGLSLEDVREAMKKHEGPFRIQVVTPLPDADVDCCAHGPKFPHRPVAGHVIVGKYIRGVVILC